MPGNVRPSAIRLSLGITKAALETEIVPLRCLLPGNHEVLTDAAIKAKRDNLHGLKENVITGKLIPAGTGLLTRRTKRTRSWPPSTSSSKMKQVKAQYIEAHDRKDELENHCKWKRGFRPSFS
jgi:DNA-directed RNA polymerase subunit beta'